MFASALEASLFASDHTIDTIQNEPIFPHSFTRSNISIDTQLAASDPELLPKDISFLADWTSSSLINEVLASTHGINPPTKLFSSEPTMSSFPSYAKTSTIFREPIPPHFYNQTPPSVTNQPSTTSISIEPHVSTMIVRDLESSTNAISSAASSILSDPSITPIFTEVSVASNVNEPSVASNVSEPSVVSNVSEPSVSSSVDVCRNSLKEKPMVEFIVPGQMLNNKGNYCVFCSHRFSKIIRHLEQVHPDEVEVSKFMSLSKDNPERRKLHDKLRKEGNFIHNESVKKTGKGTIMPERRSRTKTNSNDYIPCIHCKSLFKKRLFWLHERRCKLKNKNKTGRRVLVNSIIASSSLPFNISFAYQNEILKNMLPGEITDIALKDNIILRFGDMLYNQHPKAHLANYIRQRMRQTARLLQCCHNLCDEIKSMDEVLEPAHFDIVIAAVKQVSGWNERTLSYDVAGLPLKLGHNLKRCAEIKMSEAIKNNDELMKNKASSFLELVEINWKYLITRQALTTLSDRRYNKPDVLPVAADVKKFNTYLNDEIQYHFAELELGIQSSFRPLSELTLVSIILFNRRRSGEVQRITLKNYVDGMNASSICPEAENILSTTEKQILSSVKRIEIKGKKGRKVPVLLREIHITAIDLLIAERENSGVDPGNQFLFGRNNYQSQSPISSCEQIKKYAQKANLEKPELIRSTKLRKQIATYSQLLNLNQQELEQLCTFMGHSINVHLDYYRLPTDIVQMAKVSKILIAVEDGTPFQVQGSNIDDVVFNEDVIDPVSSNNLPNQPDDNNDDETVPSVEEPLIEEDAEAAVVEPPKKKRKRNWIQWRNSEMDSIKTHFSDVIEQKKIPGKHECICFIRKTGSNREWTSIKQCVRNYIKKLNKNE